MSQAKKLTLLQAKFDHKNWLRGFCPNFKTDQLICLLCVLSKTAVPALSAL